MNIDLCELQSKTKLFISHHHIRSALILFLLTGKWKMRRQRRRKKSLLMSTEMNLSTNHKWKVSRTYFFHFSPSRRRKWGSKKCLIRIFSAFVTSRPSWPGLVVNERASSENFSAFPLKTIYIFPYFSSVRGRLIINHFSFSLCIVSFTFIVIPLSLSLSHHHRAENFYFFLPSPASNENDFFKFLRHNFLVPL